MTIIMTPATNSFEGDVAMRECLLSLLFVWFGRIGVIVMVDGGSTNSATTLRSIGERHFLLPRCRPCILKRSNL